MIYNFFRRYVQILASMKRLNLRVLEIWYPKFFKKDLEQVFALNNLKALNHQDFLKNIKILMIYTKCSDMFLPIYLTLLFRKFVRFHGTEDILYYTNGDGIESDMLWYLDALPFEYQWTSSRKKYWFRYLRCNNELLLFIIFDRSVFHFLNKRLFRLILVFRLKLYYLFKELFINKKDMCKYFYDYLLANERLSSIFYKILYILSKDGLPFLNKKLLFEKSVFIIRTNMIVTFNNMFYNELYWFIYHSGLPNYFFLNIGNIKFYLDLYCDILLVAQKNFIPFLKNPLKRYNKWLFFLSKLYYLKCLIKFNDYENPFVILYIYLFVQPVIQSKPKIIYVYHFWFLRNTLTLHEFFMFLLFRFLDGHNDLDSELILSIFIFRRILFSILLKQSINLRGLNLILLKILDLLSGMTLYNFDKSGL